MPAGESLRSVAPLSALSEAALARLLPSCYVHSLPAGATLLAAGEVPHSAFILLEGSVEAAAAHNDRTTIVSIRSAPDQLCFAAALRGHPVLCTYTVGRSSQVAFLPAAALRRAYDADKGFALAILDLTAELLRSHMMELKNQKLRTGPERLAAWLLRQLQPQRPTALPFDKRRIAARLGMTPENLSRSFAAIAAHGVRRHGSRVTIEDPESLARFAGTDPSLDDHRL